MVSSPSFVKDEVEEDEKHLIQGPFAVGDVDGRGAGIEGVVLGVVVRSDAVQGVACRDFGQGGGR